MHYGHDHHHGGANGVAIHGVGHNAPPTGQPMQWQKPHLPPDARPATETAAPEPDIDLVERAFVEGFMLAADPTSFLRLANVPFAARTVDGSGLVLLRVELDALTDVGSVTPQLGGGGFRYDPLPAAAVSRRRRLRFAYFDGATVRQLTFAEVRSLQAE